MSLRQLGTRIGVSPSLVSQIERGRIRPSLATLVALAVELEISLDATFGLRPVVSPPKRQAAPAHYKGVAMIHSFTPLASESAT